MIRGLSLNNNLTCTRRIAFFCKSKIGQFKYGIFCGWSVQQIFRFQISMGNIMRMEKINGLIEECD